MRWERLFGELEGHAEHALLEERDALVAELRDGEWATRSWLDGLQDASEVELCVHNVGVVSGRIHLATEHVIHLESASADHLVAPAAVLWVRGATRSPGLAPGSVTTRLGWGHVLREVQADADIARFVLAGGNVIEGRIAAVGRDFVRVVPSAGERRDIPFGSLALATLRHHV